MDPVEDEEVEDEEVEDFDEAGGEDMLRCWGGGVFFLKIIVEGMYLYIRDHNSSNKG